VSNTRANGETSRSGAPNDQVTRRVFWELRHARLRLALAENDLAWTQELLVGGEIAAGFALQILDDVLDDVGGVRP
jgi:hypothetical protein